MTQSIRILVVDDNPDIQDVTARLLEKAGYAVERASGGEDALKAVYDRRPDLVLLDRQMPGIGGIEVCRRIKQDALLAGVLVVLLSGYSTESDSQSEGLESGADGYIVRPIANRELVARVDAYARIIALTKALEAQAAELRAINETAALAHSATLNLMEDAMAAQERLEASNRELRGEIAERERAQADAHRATQTLTKVMNYIPAFVFWKDNDLRYLGCNNLFAESAGMESSAAIVGKSDHELPWSETAELYRADDRRVIESKIPKLDFEERQKRPDGSIRWLNTSKVPLFDDAGHAYGVLGIYMDITERKRAEIRIQQLNRVYSVLSGINETIVREKDSQTLLMAACRIAVEKGQFRMAWIGLLDETSQIVRPVASAGAVGGYLDTINIDLKDAVRRQGPSGQALLSGEHIICADIETDPAFAPWRDEALRMGYCSVACFPLKVNGQTIGTFSLYAGEPFFFDEAEIRLLDELAMDFGFALEVHRSNDERERIEKSHARLAMAVEQASESIVITDTDGLIQYVNPAFEKTTGYTLAEAIGQNPRVLKSGKEDAASYRQLWETVQRGEVWRGHFQNKRKDGSLYEEDATISPIRDVEGKIVNYVAVKRDVTREVQLEAQFRQSQKMEAFGLLAGGVAHDFNNLMGVVIGYSDMWLVKLPPDAPIRGPLNAIKKAGLRASDLTKQLLAFSRKTILEPKILDLNEVVRDTEKMLARLIGEDIQIDTILDSTIPRIKIDPGQISQVLMNLSVNARDAMPTGGNLTIQTGIVKFDEAYVQSHLGTQPGRQVMLSVSDTGTGMPPEIVARIFEPFFTTKGVGKGTGLGLAVVHGAVTQCGGSIDVESKVGVGTTFKLYFPTTAEAVRAIGDSEDIAAQGGIETILVVEDENSLLEIASESLRTYGYSVLSARNGQDALKKVSRYEGVIDLMITDVVMPRMSGRELADALKQKLPDLKVIFMSGYTDDSVVRHGIDHEKVAFLQKPFSPFVLLKKAREVLGAVIVRESSGEDSSAYPKLRKLR